MNIKQVVQNAIPNWTGRLACHYVGYNANGQVHRDLPYTNANDPKVIAKQLELIQACGFDVVIETWQGPWAMACNQNAIAVSALCTQVGLQFCLLLDPWCAKLNTQGKATAPSIANLIAALQYPTTQTMLKATSYVPEKYVLDFNTLNPTTITDLNALTTAVPGVEFLAQNTEFSWIAYPPATITDSVAKNAWATANLQSQNANAGMKVAGVCMSFDDSGMPLPSGVATQAAFDAAGGVRNWSQSVWATTQAPAPNRVLGAFAGQFFLQQLAVTPTSAPIIAIITWNDYDEGTALEPKISELLGVNWSTL
jgi:hypothetical protein